MIQPIETHRRAALILLYAVARSKAIKAKKAAAAMDCKKAVRGKAAAKKAATFMGSTGKGTPSSLGENDSSNPNTMTLSSKLTNKMITDNNIPLNPVEGESMGSIMYGKSLNTVDIYNVNINDANAGSEIKADVISQLRERKIDPTTGNPYVIINGKKIEFDSGQLSNIKFNENNTQETINGNTNLVLAVEKSDPDTFVALVKFAAANPTQNGRPITVESMWRPLTSDKAHYEGRAVDFSSFSSGTKVNAAESGTIKLARTFGGYGNAVIIQDSEGTEYLYGHNTSFNSGTRVNEYVNSGNQITLSGSTGIAYGPHVHLEVVHPNDNIYIK